MVKDEVEKVVPAGLALLIRLSLYLGGLVYFGIVYMLTLINPARDIALNHFNKLNLSFFGGPKTVCGCMFFFVLNYDVEFLEFDGLGSLGSRTLQQSKLLTCIPRKSELLSILFSVHQL